VPWSGTLTTTTVGGKRLLAESYLTGDGWVNVPVYTFSGDRGWDGRCAADTDCRAGWQGRAPRQR